MKEKISIPSKLKSYFDQIRTSPFLRGCRWNANGVPDTIDRIILSELLSHNFNWNDLSNGVFVLRTGGTSNNPLLIPVALNEVYPMRQYFAEALSKADIVLPNTRCINLFNYRELYRSASILDDIFERCNATSFALGALCSNESIVKWNKTFSANSLMGTPSRIVSLAHYCRSHSIPLSFDTIYFGGEPLCTSATRLLIEQFTPSSIYGFFGAVETGTWGWCDHLKKPFHYNLLDGIYLEIESDVPGGYGNILVTNTYRTQYPIPRYKLGDRGRLHKENGKTILELEGERYFTFKIGNQYFSVQVLYSIFKSIEAFQVILSYNEYGYESIEALLFCEYIEEKENQEKRYSEIIKETLSINDDVDVKVHYVPFENIQQDVVTHKIKPIIDLR